MVSAATWLSPRRVRSVGRLRTRLRTLGDHLLHPLAVRHDVAESRVRLLQVGGAFRQQLTRHLGIHPHCRQRLVDLVGDGLPELPHGRHARHVHQVVTHLCGFALRALAPHQVARQHDREQRQAAREGAGPDDPPAKLFPARPFLEAHDAPGRKSAFLDAPAFQLAPVEHGRGVAHDHGRDRCGTLPGEHLQRDLPGFPRHGPHLGHAAADTSVSQGRVDKIEDRRIGDLRHPPQSSRRGKNPPLTVSLKTDVKDSG